jgi:hypothetical protein
MEVYHNHILVIKHNSDHTLLDYDTLIKTIQRSEEFDDSGDSENMQAKAIQMNWFRCYKTKDTADSLLVLIAGSDALGLLSAASVCSSYKIIFNYP